MCQLRKFCLFVGCVFYAGVCGADVLDNKINELTKRRDELKLAISQCESKTNKFIRIKTYKKYMRNIRLSHQRKKKING